MKKQKKTATKIFSVMIRSIHLDFFPINFIDDSAPPPSAPRFSGAKEKDKKNSLYFKTICFTGVVAWSLRLAVVKKIRFPC